MMGASEYYTEMIRIEREKLEVDWKQLEVAKNTYEMQKWYMEQKIAILRQNQRNGQETATRHQHEWSTTGVIPQSTGHEHLWNPYSHTPL